MKIKLHIRNRQNFIKLAFPLYNTVGKINGKWYLCKGYSLDPWGAAIMTFEPRPDGPMKFIHDGGQRLEYQVWPVKDFKSALWALRTFCAG